ncbi:MAG: sigma-54-dependent Fis family transcriptional regulator [Desulfatitalea sp.]|nr:sigma-54 dependent transcriptional regulator [Desulfatitalea sp.]NNJ99273.1 sigma-54-dependent Fis family transcriptional regulator [Desulfatitalea sp.]
MKETPPSILIVDDDQNVLQVLEARLLSSGFTILKAENGSDALRQLKETKIDLMISDMKMPGMSGMEVMTKARLLNPGLPIIFLTAYGTIPDAVKAVKAGAVDYLAKPFDGRELVFKLRKVLESTPRIADRSEDDSLLNDMHIATSPKMKALYSLVRKVSHSDVNVLILGDSGVGKERIARMIHQLSSRSSQPFVVVDCGSTPASLLESELFGHVRGAFTHAVNDKRGLIETADKGTLFLDEIGNISPEMQVRLLRFLEDRKIRRIGDLKENAVNCRVLAATNSDLSNDIKNGRFREDLYYRLRVVTLFVPKLSERKEDIPVLAQYFVDDYVRKNGVRPVRLPVETIEYLCNYPWQGNVRELKNAIEAGIVLCHGNTLRPQDMHLSGLPAISMTFDDAPDSFSLEDTERHAIIRALKQAGGVQKEAANLLGISRRAIHYKIKKYEIDTAGLRNQNV